MSDAEITTVVRPPETIVVNPTSLGYTYDRVGDQDIISILIEDRRVGALMVTLTPEGAQHVAAHLAAMVGDLDALRAEHGRRTGGAR